MAKLIPLKQNTPEWMEFRRGKIGGSGLGGIWQQRAYNAEDVRTLLEGRNFDFDAYLEQLKKENPRKRSVTVDDMKLLLTDEDKEELQSGGDRKIGFYEVLAEQISIAPQDDEDEAQWRDARDRGHGLEDAAAQDAAARGSTGLANFGVQNAGLLGQSGADAWQRPYTQLQNYQSSLSPAFGQQTSSTQNIQAPNNWLAGAGGAAMGAGLWKSIFG